MPTVELLNVLREFTAREKISIPASTVAVPEIAHYEPLAKYLATKP
jgi:hypothetical protein